MSYVIIANEDLTEDLYHIIREIHVEEELLLEEESLLEPEVVEKNSHREVYINREDFTNDFDVEYLRRKVFQYYDMYNAAPTVGECVQILKDHINFKGDCDTVCRMLGMDVDGDDGH